MLLALLIGLLFLFISLGMEIAWAIGASALGYIIAAQLLTDGGPAMLSLPFYFLDGVDSFALLAIPLFIFAGELMSETGVTQRLVRVAQSFVGHIRGGLANVAVVANFIMAGISGSAIADAAATGTVLVPQMVKRGYPVRFACAVISASSTVGPIIPPSVSFVLIAAIVNLSVGQLFLAGVIPGVLMSLSMFVLTYFIARRRGFPVEARASWGERMAALFAAALPLAAPLLIVRVMTSGIATPTEAAAVLVLYIMIIALFAYRSIGPLGLLHCASRAAMVSSIIMLTVGTAQIFSALTVLENFGGILTDAMLAISGDVNVLLFIFNILLLILGTFMEPLPLMLVLGPIVFPLFQGLGVDPVHLAVVMVINVILGLLTPPVGLILSVVGVIGRIDPMEIFKELWPYMAVLTLVLLLVTYIPWLSLWLPRLFFAA